MKQPGSSFGEVMEIDEPRISTEEGGSSWGRQPGPSLSPDTTASIPPLEDARNESDSSQPNAGLIIDIKLIANTNIKHEHRDMA